jgi:hypothetical protein
MFSASGEGAVLIRFFSIYIAGSWVALGALFVANGTFNNLGFPTWSTVFNWGRATLGTLPFVWFGAQYGAEGILAGQALGAVLFGVAAIIVSLRIVNRLAIPHGAGQPEEVATTAPPLPPFASGKAATALDWADPEEQSK